MNITPKTPYNIPYFKNLTIEIAKQVSLALQEDIGTGDINALLVADSQIDTAIIINREPMILSGQAWVEQSFQLVDKRSIIEWRFQDGDKISAGQILAKIHAPTRALLTAERTALNFLQTLSAVATKVHQYVSEISDLPTKLLDTRKTIPQLRLAQKYAVLCGGGHNHRIGLHDAFLIKENHIMACGGIANAITKARQIANKPIELEVENFAELKQAIDAKADIIMLDNFTLADTQKAVSWVQEIGKPCLLEASGDIDLHNLRQVALTGVDFISIGALTKHIQAIDLSMRFVKR